MLPNESTALSPLVPLITHLRTNIGTRLGTPRMAAPFAANPRLNPNVCTHARLAEDTPLIPKRDEGNDEKDVLRGKDVSETESLGYAVLVLAAVFFCLMTLITRYLGAYTSFSVPSLVFVRGVAQGLLSLAWIAAFLDFRTVFTVPRKYVPHVIGRAICGAVSLCLNYKALSLVPLGITTCILFFHPILTLMLSSVILGEHVGKLDIIAAAISFVGVVLVSNPTLSIDLASVHSPGYVVGVISVFIASCILSCAIIIIRSAGQAVHYMTLVLTYAFFVAVAGAAMGGADVAVLLDDPKGLCIALTSSVFGFLAQTCLNFGFQRCRAGTGSVVRTIDVPLAFVLALIFLHEVPRTMSIVGSVLVVLGVALVGLKKFGKR